MHLKLETSVSALKKAKNIDFWRKLNPDLTISDRPFDTTVRGTLLDKFQQKEYALNLFNEGYLEPDAAIPISIVKQMRNCIENVKKADFPPSFSLLYDIFYEVLSYFHPSILAVLGEGYQFVPECTIFYIDPKETACGGLPHRDMEALRGHSINSDGMPTAITFWRLFSI